MKRAYDLMLDGFRSFLPISEPRQIHVAVHESVLRGSFLPGINPTLQLVAQHFEHDHWRQTICVKTRCGVFSILPLTTPLSRLRRLGADGDGSQDRPFRVLIERSGGAGAGAGMAAADQSAALADALFAPFEAAHFPCALDEQQLSELLGAPPATAVPAAQPFPELWPSGQADSLFAPLSGPPHRQSRLAARLLSALMQDWPLGRPSELLFTSFWDTLGFTLPEFAGKLLGLNIVVHRNVEDSTITQASRKRDYFVTLNGVLCIGGEDRSCQTSLQDAVQECVLKHRGANAALYGRLGYILLTVVAGQHFGVYAMRLSGNYSTATIVAPFPVQHDSNRRKALLTWINITRWMRTVAELRLLPPRPSLALFDAVKRPPPFLEECPEHTDCTLQLQLRNVLKMFFAPRHRLQNLLNVYGLLNSGRIPGAIKFTCFKVDQRVCALRYPPEGTTQDDLATPSVAEICLQLQPVAAAWALQDKAELHSLCRDVLSTLAALHRHGYVHRDVRRPNILRDTQRFILIDWELASPKGDPVFWHAPAGNLPRGVDVGTPWEPWMDLWQLGQVMEAQPLWHDDASNAFLAKLLGREFADAGEAYRDKLW